MTSRFMALINGRPGEGNPLLHDRALHYGDGVFRTLAIHDGSVLDLAGQLEHLQADALRLDIAPEMDSLSEEAQRLARGQAAAVLKIIVSRGNSERGYAASRQLKPNRCLLLSPPPPDIGARQRQGVSLYRCATRLACGPQLAGIKHLNRLEQVLARREWEDASMAEGLVCNIQNHIISGVQSNLFLVRDAMLLTPELSQSGIAGRMRARIMELAAASGSACQELVLTWEDLARAQEVFLSNSLIGIWPVIACDGQSWPVGARTRQLQTALQHPALS